MTEFTVIETEVVTSFDVRGSLYSFVLKTLTMPCITNLVIAFSREGFLNIIIIINKYSYHLHP
jgi:hypothetical protein